MRRPDTRGPESPRRGARHHQTVANGRLRQLGIVFLGIFMAAVLVAHVVRPDLSPLNHMISEYANGRYGFVMDIGFGAWAYALVASSVYVFFAGPRRALPLGVLLAIVAAGVVVIAIFPTETKAGHLPAGNRLTASGRAHDLAGSVVTVALVAAALASVAMEWSNARARRAAIAGLMMLALVTVALGLAGQQLAGLRQRLTVAAACCWNATVLVAGPRRAGPEATDDASRTAERAL